MEDMMEQKAVEEQLEQEVLEQEALLEEVVAAEESEQEVVAPPQTVEDSTYQLQLQGVASVLATYGGSGQEDRVADELTEIMEGQKQAQQQAVEQSRKEGMLLYALSALVHDPSEVMMLMGQVDIEFDLFDMGALRDFLEPIYQEKPYLFKTINPLRGAHVANGMGDTVQPTIGELGRLSMEEYTAYRTARGSVSR